MVCNSQMYKHQQPVGFSANPASPAADVHSDTGHIIQIRSDGYRAGPPDRRALGQSVSPCGFSVDAHLPGDSMKGEASTLGK